MSSSGTEGSEPASASFVKYQDLKELDLSAVSWTKNEETGKWTGTLVVEFGENDKQKITLHDVSSKENGERLMKQQVGRIAIIYQTTRKEFTLSGSGFSKLKLKNRRNAVDIGTTSEEFLVQRDIKSMNKTIEYRHVKNAYVWLKDNNRALYDKLSHPDDLSPDENRYLSRIGIDKKYYPGGDKFPEAGDPDAVTDAIEPLLEKWGGTKFENLKAAYETHSTVLEGGDALNPYFNAENLNAKYTTLSESENPQISRFKIDLFTHGLKTTAWEFQKTYREAGTGAEKAQALDAYAANLRGALPHARSNGDAETVGKIQRKLQTLESVYVNDVSRDLSRVVGEGPLRLNYFERPMGTEDLKKEIDRYTGLKPKDIRKLSLLDLRKLHALAKKAREDNTLREQPPYSEFIALFPEGNLENRMGLGLQNMLSNRNEVRNWLDEIRHQEGKAHAAEKTRYQELRDDSVGEGKELLEAQGYTYQVDVLGDSNCAFASMLYIIAAQENASTITNPMGEQINALNGPPQLQEKFDAGKAAFGEFSNEEDKRKYLQDLVLGETADQQKYVALMFVMRYLAFQHCDNNELKLDLASPGEHVEIQALEGLAERFNIPLGTLSLNDDETGLTENPIHPNDALNENAVIYYRGNHFFPVFKHSTVTNLDAVD